MSRKLKANRENLVALIVLAVVYVVGCAVTDSPVDGVVFLTIAGGIGGATGFHHWANAKEHQSRSEPK